MNGDEDSSVLDIPEPAESILQTKKQTRMDGYLYRLEQRPIIGMNKKKYWFVLPIDTPVLYWYKSPNDINCAGRIVLSGAAFTFNPREYGTFEIHVDNKCYVLEASDNKIRVDWLSGLQYNRKQYYQKTLQNGKMNGNEPKEEFTFPEIGASSSTNNKQESSTKLEQSVHDANNSAEEDHQYQSNSRTLPVSIPTAHSPLMNENESRSTFYLREDGELHPGSLEIPPPIHNIQSIEELLNKVTEEANQLELPTKKFIQKARNSLRTISQTSHGQPNLIFPLPKENCDRCSEFSQTMEQLRNRCYELADDLVVYQDLVISLKKSVVAAHNERDALQRYCVDATSDMDKLAFVIERESNLTKMQFTQSQLRREIENLRAENRMLESENCSLNATVEAYQESVRTKEELILRYAEQQNQNNNQQEKPSNQSNSLKNGGPSSQQQIPRIGSQPIPFFCTSPEVTEALLVDFGTPTDIAAKNVFKETDVNDLNEMQDLIDGYRNQNKFLNNEVIELQKIIQALEDRERRLIRQNFTLEAFYYQLKTKYIMLLNHFRSSDQPRRVIEPSVIQDLINEVSRPHSPMRMHNANNSLALETMRSPSALAAFISDPRGIPITAYEDLNGGILRNKDPETDSLGFYLTSPRSRKAILQAKMEAEEGKGGQKLEMEEEIKINEGEKKKEEHSSPPKLSQSFYESGGQQNMGSPPNAEEMAQNSGSAPSTSYFAYFNELNEKPLQPTKDKDWLLKMAADSQKRSEEILSSIEPGNNQEFVDWLARWDAFLVNHVLQPMSRQPQLKTLVRCGIPHAYRSRVWSGLVDFLVGPLQVETGKGYYECLLRKSHRLNSEEDSALKQIDLDLARTLPNNKLFETEQSPKAGELKNILYAFRSHNKNVEYCQGLNRLGAIGLLYLEESQAFWFLVACVERLQPVNYYSSNLVGAVIDQRVLLDLVQDKMPSLHSHLQKLEVNLSLFTLSWFLTIFVDVLSHNVYIKIFDVFLYEGNKVLFRFALAILRLVESRLMECSSFSGVHTCLSNLSSMITDYKALAKIAFNTLNPFPAKLIESRRQNYYLQHKSGKFKI